MCAVVLKSRLCEFTTSFIVRAGGDVLLSRLKLLWSSGGNIPAVFFLPLKLLGPEDSFLFALM